MNGVTVLELDEGTVRLEGTLVNRLLSRLHNAWKRGEISWIRGQMRNEEGTGFCMLGGIEHMLYKLKSEDGLDEATITALRVEVRDKIVWQMNRDFKTTGLRIDSINDRRWRDVSQPLACIQKALLGESSGI